MGRKIFNHIPIHANRNDRQKSKAPLVITIVLVFITLIYIDLKYRATQQVKEAVEWAETYPGGQGYAQP